MGWLQQRLGSSIGSKLLMALSGLGLLGFLFGHLSGNLLMFAGPEAINAYAKGLKELPFGLIYVARAGVLGLFVLHVFTAVRLQLKNKAARPEPYAFSATIQASAASRTMIWSGLLVLAYVLFHLAHFTWHRVTPVETLPNGAVNVYKMVIDGFSVPQISISYIVAMIVLGLHLSHGIASCFQTFGLCHKKYNIGIKVGSYLVAWGLALGFISIPVSVWLGCIN